MQVTPTTDLQAVIKANAPRTTFCFAAGVYRLTGTIWTEDRFPRLDLRAGAVIDGQNGAFRAFTGLEASSSQQGTVVLGGIFQHFGNASGPSWVSPLGLTRNTVVDGTEFRENFNAGLTINGNNARVSNVHVHHNGKYGIVAAARCLECAGPKGAIIEDSEIAFNNTRRLDPGYDAGGTKFSMGTDGMIVRRNKIHDNYGSGVWFDGRNTNAQVYDNVIYDNYRWGIFWELSYGGVKIHHNTLTGNGVGDGTSTAHNAQLVIANSDGSTGGIEVYSNTIDGIASPLSLIDSSGRPIRTKNVYVHHNVMTLRASTSRVGAFGTDLFSASANNRFAGNTYRVLNTSGKYWVWNGKTLTWVDWKALGHDSIDGVLSSIS